jgi:acyl-CoA thioesterase
LATPKEVADSMYARDRASQWLGLNIVEMRAGFAQMTMEVKPHMANGHDLGHGGLTFALADSAFAFACNSYNINAVAAACSIEFLAPTRVGDVLTATAQEQALSGRNGVYDVRVTNQRNEVVALFRGKSTQIRGSVIPESEKP